MWRLSLAQRLFLSIAVPLIPALAVVFYNEISVRNTRVEEVNEMALRSGQTASLELDRIMNGFEGVLTVMAANAAVKTLAGEDCSAYLSAIIKEFPQFTNIAVTDARGDLRCRSEPPISGLSLAARSYFPRAIAARDFVVGEFSSSVVSGVDMLPLAMPFFDDRQEIAGVIVAGLKVEWLGQRLRERDATKNSALTIADRNGTIVAREPLPERFVGTRIPDSFLPLVTAAAPGTMQVRSQDGTRRVIGYVPASISGTGLYVSSGLASDEAFAAIDAGLRRGVAVAVLVGLLAIAVSWYLAENLVRKPVQKLGATIALWRQGEASARTGMTGADEIGAVGVAIDEFLNELEAGKAKQILAEDHRQLLIEELAHRIKNLMATVMAVAKQSLKRAPDDEMASFQSRLATMAQTHTLLVTAQWSSARIDEIVKTGLAAFRANDGARFEISGPDLTIRPRAALALSMTLHELCTNAVKYGALSNESGRVAITWSVGNGVFLFGWQESGGPEVRRPKRNGFGSRMIERVFAAEFGATVTLNYHIKGLTLSASGPADLIVGEDERVLEEKWKLKVD